MGADCAKSKKMEQYQKRNSTQSLMRSGSLGSLKNNKIMLNLFQWIGPQSSCVEISNKQNFKEYQSLLIGSFNSIKFIPKIGFVYDKTDYTMRPDFINFKTLKSDTDDIVIQCQSQLFNVQQLWRKIPSAGLLIDLNKQIKIGNHIIKLRYFHNQDQIRAMKQGCKQIQIKQITQKGVLCRICKKQGSQKSPLILPCDCIDSSQIVHQACFSRQVFDQKVQLQDYRGIYHFLVNKKYCEHCHAQYQKFIWKRFLSVVTIYPGYYAIFQKTFAGPHHISNITEFVIVRFNEEIKQIKIGRSNVCQYILLDQNLSKVHARIEFKNNNLYIHDKSNRVGTFIEYNKKQLHIGSSYLFGKQYISLSTNHPQSKDNFLRRPSFQF